MMTASTHRLQHRRISINFRIKNRKYVNNLSEQWNLKISIGFRIKNGKSVINQLEHQVKSYKFEIKNEKNVDKFERSGYNRSKERLKTENT